MKIHRGQIDYSTLQGHVITIGTFDGLHVAHKSIVDSVINLSLAKGCESILITFEPHPRSVIYPKDDGLRLLTELDEKIELIRQTGIDHLVVYPFTVEFSQLPPQEYIEEFIIEKFKPKGIIVGFDHRFGLNRQGDYNMLDYYAKKHNIELIEISKKESNKIKISSTTIRKSLSDGKIKDANQLLGYRYFLSGEVIKGDSVGASLGYPTANLRLGNQQKLVPKSGIYAAFVHVQDAQYDGLLYIGQKPSLNDGNTIFIEVNLRDFKGYLYGEHLKIELVEFVREDQKFSDLESLKSKIQEDEMLIIDILEAEKNEKS